MRRIILFCCLLVSTAHAQLERPGSVVWNTHSIQDFGKSSSVQTALSIDASLPGRLQYALDSLYAKTSEVGRHGVAASVIVPGLAQWSGAVGESYPGVGMSTELEFEIASNTKTFITALIFKLQEEGKLSLKDSLWKWLPSFKNIDSTITIRNLLEHSSGIYDYLNDDADGSLLETSYLQTPSYHWTPEELVSEHVGEPNFKVGTSYRYSNTNFILLGMIAKLAAGMECGQALHERFFTPLGLSHTYAGWADSIVEEFAHNWFKLQSNNSLDDLGTIEKTAQLTLAHTAGGIVSTPTELAKWAKALYDGSVLNKTSMAQMFTFHQWPDNVTVYGRGVVKVSYYTHVFYGHDGHLPGFTTDMFSNPKDSVTIVVYKNSEPLSSQPNDPSLNDYLIALLDQIYQPTSSVSISTPESAMLMVYPNPVVTESLIRYSVPEASAVRLALYDILGREVQVFVDQKQNAGEHSIRLNASAIENGTYCLRLSNGSQTQNRIIKIVK